MTLQDLINTNPADNYSASDFKIYIKDAKGNEAEVYRAEYRFDSDGVNVVVLE
jgi:hypothetical protein